MSKKYDKIDDKQLFDTFDRFFLGIAILGLILLTVAYFGVPSLKFLSQDLIDFIQQIIVNLVPTFLVFVFTYILFYYRIQKMRNQKELEELSQRIAEDVGANLKEISDIFIRDIGFSMITNVDDGSEFAAIKVKQASIIRVIGTARQHVVEQLEQKPATSYLRETENRFKQKKKIIYRRITTKDLSNAFFNHLVNLFDLAQQNNHTIEISLVPNLFTSISYQIFDDKSVLLVVDNDKLSNMKDNAAMFWSTNPQIIDVFTKHFDNAWSKLEQVKSADEFTKIVR